MKTKNYILSIITFILLALWIPSVVSKLRDFNQFKTELGQQPFSRTFVQILSYALPFLEIAVVVLLIPVRSRWVGHGLSSVLMAAFTGFVGLAWAGAWAQLPCGCGKLIADLTWAQHFWFNLFFLLLSILAATLYYRLRGEKPKSGFSFNRFRLQRE